ncbi:hypothetical protein ABZX40_17065 [Streptomyces sp. NPDC004610]|uniref:hypothetical protein n=1 Tax=unclassified Streptomyces TaxID=2593676 RepID=UPI0033A3B2C5
MQTAPESSAPESSARESVARESSTHEFSAADSDPACRPGHGPGALSRAEAADAIELLLGKVARLRTLAGDRYPLYAHHGDWVLSRRGSWTPGFWVGLLRLTARITGDRTDRRRAEAAIAGLTERLGDDTVTRSMTFWYGAGTDRPDLTREAARRLLATADPGHGLVPIGTAWEPENGRRLVEVDCWGPLVRLLSRYAEELGPESEGAARAWRTVVAQTRACLRRCVRADSSDDQLPTIVERFGISSSPEPSPPTAAARPAAWALLGLAESAAALSGTDPALSGTGSTLAADCVQSAVRLQGRLLGQRAGPVEEGLIADTSAGTSAGTSADTSADAIAAVALHRLPSSVPHFAASARLRTAQLVREQLRADGTFTGTRYRVADGRLAEVESVWGYFFLLLALAIDAELIRSDEF